jgi:ribosomal protein S7
MNKPNYTEVDSQHDRYLSVVAEKTFLKSLERTLQEVSNYVPAPATSMDQESNEVKDPIKMFYTALGESYMPTREEYDFVTKGGTSGGQKFVPRLALAIARNRATPKMDVYYKRIDELLRAYQIMRKNPWVLNRVLRVLERGFLKPTTTELKKEYHMQEGLCAYVFPNRWEMLLEPLLSEKSKKVWTERTALTRSLIESDWADNTFPMFENRVFVRDVVLLTEDDVQHNASGPAGQTTIRFVKPKLWKEVPAIKPHVDIMEKVASDRSIAYPHVHVYERLSDSTKSLFLFLKDNMPRWRIPTESGFLLENVLEGHRKEKELERNMKRRATPITQLKELVEDESSEEVGFPDSSADQSESDEEPRAMELFEALDNPLTPIQMYRWGVVEPGTEKDFLELCHLVEKERQEIRDNLTEEAGEQYGQQDPLSGEHSLEEKDEDYPLETESNSEEEENVQVFAQPSTESNRISSKTRRYLSSPRSKADSSYHRGYEHSPLPMEYSFSYFLNRWPKSMNSTLDVWVAEVKKILLKCDGILGLLEKKEFQLVSSLVESIQSELSENLRVAALSSKDGRTLDFTRAYSRNIMKQGKGATANRIAEHSSRALSISRKKAFPLFLTDHAFRRTLPILDIKKVFTGGGTRKHSAVNHITERRAGFNTIRWATENAFKNPRNTRLRAVSTLSKELLSMSKAGKPSYAQQQRSKVYAEIWALMGRPDHATGEEESKKPETKKILVKDSKKPNGSR